MQQTLRAIFDAIDGPILVYFVLINSSYLFLIVCAAAEFARHLRRSAHSWRLDAVSSRLLPGVSLVVPAYNEAAGIVPSVSSMLSLRHPRHEVVVVDDGSTDDTFDRLVRAFSLVGVDRPVPADIACEGDVRGVYVPDDGWTRLTVVRKANAGKTHAVNTGINIASEPLVAVIDADSILDPDALVSVSAPFAEDPVRTVATGGVIRAANGCRIRDGRVVEVGMPSSWLARIQVVEYLRSFLLGRSGWSRLRCLILISGAFGLFRRDVLVDVGGLRAGSIGEDFELVMRMHERMTRQHRDYRIEFVSEPIAWTEVPTTLRVLRAQRRRWHRGLWEVLWSYRGMLGNPRYGRIGLLVLPWFWAFELAAPAIELVGLVLVTVGLVFGVVDPVYALLFLVLAYGYALLVSCASLAIEELTFHKYTRWRDLVVALAASIAENVGYRQLTAWWRCEGLVAGIRGTKAEWGTMTRTGFDDTPAVSGAGSAA
ncbi:glycosyltransferase family 2 protein [Mobilicoccus massiliensis]|uniref:glycosyltransferase family 2 protein n=1 Tax=Mobilicoccus massiliensis TaxID=1522310 RepID=UPI00058C817F|nr:glycosyltransferase family 2 protein [Mobilicoccus massiliensis]